MKHRDYQKDLERLVNECAASSRRPRLLMHACCAPCSSYCLEYLRNAFDITVYFYNPNIDTSEEYALRAGELSRFIKESGYIGADALIVGPYEPERFEAVARGHESDPERGERCRRCFELRLSETERLFSERGDFDYFCTTLSVSPHKDVDCLNDVGLTLSRRYLPTDFKKRGGYVRSIELSREYGLYRQDYCGCIYSRRERQNK